MDGKTTITWFSKRAKYSESCFSLVEGHLWDPVPIPVNTAPI